MIGNLSIGRREFLAAIAAGTFPASFVRAASSPFPVHFRQASPNQPALNHLNPSADVFQCEREAVVIEGRLNLLLETKALPLAVNFHGVSPLPLRYKPVAENVSQGEFDLRNVAFEEGLAAWLAALGRVRRAAFFALPNHVIRYEVASEGEYRVGFWKQVWKDGQLLSSIPMEETLVKRDEPLFRDITDYAFQNVPSFHDQLLKGNTWWRSRLDAATGIDIYGNNGIAAGDFDNDGFDEIYICQPAGLPNRLYKNHGDGTFEDITANTGVGVLDNTTSALFLDLRNSGLQDLVVLCGPGPLLFLNNGDGTFRNLPNAFRFAKPPQGSFTGMAAADYDGDGRLDLYLCCYVYFQSEDQYRYPVPYHDARNGPPNFLFRNHLDKDGGFFEDVTEQSGLYENNDRYSFAATWCDFDGDGSPELYVANDFGQNNLYRKQDGRFYDEAQAAGVLNIGPAMSASCFDYDADGKPDLYVSNMWTVAGQRLVNDPDFAPARAAPDDYRRHSKGNSLFRNRGDGSFEETSMPEHVEMGRWAWSSDAFDFDNDGSPELYVTCGMLSNAPSGARSGDIAIDLDSFFWRQVVAKSPPDARPTPSYENGWNSINELIREDYNWCGHQANVFYVRRKALSGEPTRYYDFSGVSGIDFAEDSRAFSVLDIDGDGNLDMVLKSRLGPQVRVLRNECGIAKSVIVVRLHGTKSNRDAIGARVEVDGHVQWLSAGSGFLSQHSKGLHFALADAKTASVKIVWPSGLHQHFTSLAPSFRYDFEEGSSAYKTQPLLQRRKDVMTVQTKLEPDNLPAPSATWLLEPIPLPDSHRGPGFVCLYTGSLPTGLESLPLEVVDLSTAAPDIPATYALFCRYLFEYRAIGLRLPLLLLVDAEGRAHKIYFEIPTVATLKTDLQLMNSPDRQRLALPFAGLYFYPQHRNYFKFGAAFYWAGYPNYALPYLKEEVRRNPSNWKCWNAIGQLQFDAGSYPDAISNLTRALALEPTYQPALLTAGLAYAKTGNLPAAEQLLRRGVAANPRDADAANQLGLVCSQRGRQDEAKKYFELAIQLRPDHTSAINNLGVLYVTLGKPQDAIAAFRYGIRVAPDDDQLYLNLGRVYIMLGDRVHAREVMQELLSQKPGDPVATKALAELQTR